jgi:hypothetical protein
MTGTRAPLHLGGPLGALGLGCVGGAVALAIAAINRDPPPPPGEAPVATPALSVDIESPTAQTPAFDETGETQLAQVETAPAVVLERPARAEGTEVQFIVRLKGAPEIDVITRNFKRDPAAAQAAWQDLVTRLPGLSDFTLAGASYSGEIKLAYQMPPGTPATPEEIRAVQDRLLKIEGVSYADPDYVAHPGKD